MKPAVKTALLERTRVPKSITIVRGKVHCRLHGRLLEEDCFLKYFKAQGKEYVLCKKCHKESLRRYREKNQEYLLKWQRDYVREKRKKEKMCNSKLR